MADDDTDTRRAFINELWRRFEEVQQWAIENWPDPDQPLSSSNFVAARQEILALGRTGNDAKRVQEEAEPADGGAQYIDTTPAPWP